MLVVVLTFSVTALALQIALTSTVPQSGSISVTSPGALTGPQPYTFPAQEVAQCTSIDSISVTLTLNEADTAPGELDFNDLTLGLEGIDTGIALNGCLSDQTVTLTGTPTKRGGHPGGAASRQPAGGQDNR